MPWILLTEPGPRYADVYRNTIRGHDDTHQHVYGNRLGSLTTCITMLANILLVNFLFQRPGKNEITTSVLSKAVS